MLYCGWAPLSACSVLVALGFGFSYYGRSVGFNFTFGIRVNNFTFVPLTHFHDRSPGQFRVAHREVTKSYNTTVINNQVIRGNNNSLIVRGVPVDRVARATHTDIRPVKIQANANEPRSPQMGRDGRTLTVFRPDLPKPKPGIAPRLVGEGVAPAPHFDLHSRVESANAVRDNSPRNPTVSTSPQGRPVIPNPAFKPVDNGNAARNNRDNRIPQPNTDKPGSIIMRGPNQPVTPSRNDNNNAAQTPPFTVRRGQDSQPQTPNQPNRGDNQRIVTPPVRPQQTVTPSQNPTAPAIDRADIDQRRNNAEQQRQMIQQQLQQQRIQQQQQQNQQQQQQRDVMPRQQRDFQPQQVTPTPRQEAPARSFTPPQQQPNVNNNQNFRPQAPVRSEPVAPPRTFEQRPAPAAPAPEVRSAPPQYSAPARSDNGGGGQRGGGGGNGNSGGGNGNQNGNGNGGGRNR